MHTSWLRYASALVTALVLYPVLLWKRPQDTSPLSEFPKNFFWIAAIGLVTFAGSAYAQYKGLGLTTSTANSLIVATEPLFVVLLAWIFLREKISGSQGFVFLVAITGFFLLSNVKPGNILAGFAGFNMGNLLLLLSMPCEATQTIGSRGLAGRVKPATVLIWTLPIGFAVFTAYLLISGQGLPDPRMSLGSIFATFWLGPLGTTFSYTFWTFALVDAPVAAVALTLFVQPILGALTGMVFLGERMDFWQWLGAALILGALSLQTNLTLRRAA